MLRAFDRVASRGLVLCDAIRRRRAWLWVAVPDALRQRRRPVRRAALGPARVHAPRDRTVVRAGRASRGLAVRPVLGHHFLLSGERPEVRLQSPDEASAVRRSSSRCSAPPPSRRTGRRRPPRAPRSRASRRRATRRRSRRRSPAAAATGSTSILSAVGEPMPPLDPTKAVIAALPEPEKKGVLADPRAARGRAGAGAAGLREPRRALARRDPRVRRRDADSKAVADAATLRRGPGRRPRTTRGLNARAAVAKAMGSVRLAASRRSSPSSPRRSRRSPRSATATAPRSLSAFHAKALADAGDLEKALAARERAYAELKALGALDKGGRAAASAVLARIDLALAGPLFDDARDDAALECCARARAIFKTADAMRDLEASAIEATILIDRGNPAGGDRGHEEPRRTASSRSRTRRSSRSSAPRTRRRCASRARRRSRLEFLRKAIGRAKELGLSPNEESPLRAAMALTYVQSGQNEPAHAALEVAAEVRGRAGAAPARAGRAVQPRDPAPDAGPARGGREGARARARDHPRRADPRSRRVGGRRTSRSPSCSSTRASPRRPLKYLREVATVAEDLGIRFEEVRLPTTGVTTGGGEPIHVRLGGGARQLPDRPGLGRVRAGVPRDGAAAAGSARAKARADEKAPADMAERLRRVRPPGAEAPARGVRRRARRSRRRRRAGSSRSGR